MDNRRFNIHANYYTKKKKTKEKKINTEKQRKFILSTQNILYFSSNITNTNNKISLFLFVSVQQTIVKYDHTKTI